MTKYRVVFEPDDGGWHVHIPKVQGCRTWGRSIAEARRNIREALAVALDDDDRDAIAEAAVFDEKFNLPADAKGLLAELERHHKSAEQARARELRARRLAALKLAKGLGFSLRDVGSFVGLTQEGVRGLLKDAPVKARRKAAS